MGFKPIKYNAGESMVKIKVLEPTGALLENWTIMMSDLGKFANLMRRKYGVNMAKEKDKDLDWIR
jgi:hypothetical protein